MPKSYKTILFTSNLSENSRQAFTHAAMLATQFGSKIVLLYVVDKMPESVEGRMLGLFGEERWQAILKNHMDDAHRMLIGKVSSKEMVQAALSEFCRDEGISRAECGHVEHEIAVIEGDIVETILHQCDQHGCDLIVMGASKGLLSGTSVGHNIKSVLKRAKVPVVVVPPATSR